MSDSIQAFENIDQARAKDPREATTIFWLRLFAGPLWTWPKKESNKNDYCAPTKLQTPDTLAKMLKKHLFNVLSKDSDGLLANVPQWSRRHLEVPGNVEQVWKQLHEDATRPDRNIEFVATTNEEEIKQTAMVLYNEMLRVFANAASLDKEMKSVLLTVLDANTMFRNAAFRQWPLAWSAYFGKTAALEFLLMDSDNVQTRANDFVLLYAAAKGKNPTRMLRMLMDKKVISKDAPNRLTYDQLKIVLQNTKNFNDKSDTHLVDDLIARTDDIDFTDLYVQSIMYGFSDHNAIKRVLKREQINYQWKEYKIFRTACAYGNLEVVEALLKSPNRLDWAAKDSDGFKKAAEFGRINIVRRYLQLTGADREYVNWHADNDYAFRMALQNSSASDNNDHLNIVKLMMSSGGLPDINIYAEGSSALKKFIRCYPNPKVVWDVLQNTFKVTDYSVDDYALLKGAAKRSDNLSLLIAMFKKVGDIDNDTKARILAKMPIAILGGKEQTLRRILFKPSDSLTEYERTFLETVLPTMEDEIGLKEAVTAENRTNEQEELLRKTLDRLGDQGALLDAAKDAFEKIFNLFFPGQSKPDLTPETKQYLQTVLGANGAFGFLFERLGLTPPPSKKEQTVELPESPLAEQPKPEVESPPAEQPKPEVESVPEPLPKEDDIDDLLTMVREFNNLPAPQMEAGESSPAFAEEIEFPPPPSAIEEKKEAQEGWFGKKVKTFGKLVGKIAFWRTAAEEEGRKKLKEMADAVKQLQEKTPEEIKLDLQKEAEAEEKEKEKSAVKQIPLPTQTDVITGNPLVNRIENAIEATGIMIWELTRRMDEGLDFYALQDLKDLISFPSSLFASVDHTKTQKDVDNWFLKNIKEEARDKPFYKDLRKYMTDVLSLDSELSDLRFQRDNLLGAVGKSPNVAQMLTLFIFAEFYLGIWEAAFDKSVNVKNIVLWETPIEESQRRPLLLFMEYLGHLPLRGAETYLKTIASSELNNRWKDVARRYFYARWNIQINKNGLPSFFEIADNDIPSLKINVDLTEEQRQLMLDFFDGFAERDFSKSTNAYDALVKTGLQPQRLNVLDQYFTLRWAFDVWQAVEFAEAQKEGKEVKLFDLGAARRRFL